MLLITIQKGKVVACRQDTASVSDKGKEENRKKNSNSKMSPNPKYLWEIQRCVVTVLGKPSEWTLSQPFFPNDRNEI